MVTFPEGYYSRFDPTKNFERHLYRNSRVVQGAELNETQEQANDRIKGIADALFRDGSVIRDAGINVDQDTGETTLAPGVVYVRGAMRGVAPLLLTIPLLGTVSIGIFLQDRVVTELEDPTLRDPGIATLNFAEPGAARLEVVAVWGVAGDGTSGDFYPVYTVINGVPQSTLPPPQIDALAVAIAAYDRDSTGGYYVTEGLTVQQLDDVDADQVLSLAAGNARVNGRQVLLRHAQRVVYPAVPDLKQVTGEPHIALGGTETVPVNQGPVSTFDQVQITTQKTVSLTHGAFTGVSDILPDSPVVTLVAVNQGGTWNGTAFVGGVTYTVGTDYTLSSDSVNWAPGGAEPAPGSTYTVVYRYIAVVTPTNPTATGFQVTGAVVGTTINVSYRWKRPRIDLLCVDPDGFVTYVQGVPNDVAPRRPVPPDGLLALASLYQTWTTVSLTLPGRTILPRSVRNDAVRLQTMTQLESLEGKVDNLFAVVSEHQLKTEAALSDPTSKRGIFVDNFENDDKRNAGLAQTAAVVDGALTLAVTNVQIQSVSLAGTQTLTLNAAGIFPVVQQTLRTGSMLCNPYLAFEPIPARCTLNPATDFWTAVNTVWASPQTTRFTTREEVIDRVISLGWLTRQIGVTTEVLVSSTTELRSVRTEEAQFLRQITIAFTLQGFGAAEVLQTVKFDGVSIPFTA